MNNKLNYFYNFTLYIISFLCILCTYIQFFTQCIHNLLIINIPGPVQPVPLFLLSPDFIFFDIETEIQTFLRLPFLPGLCTVLYTVNYFGLDPDLRPGPYEKFHPLSAKYLVSAGDEAAAVGGRLELVGC